MNITTRYAIPTLIALAAIAAAISFIFIAPARASAQGLFGAGPHTVGSTLEVSINDSGTATVRGAKVTAISGSTITAQTLFGATPLNWSVVTNSTTAISPKAAIAPPSLSNVKVGDYISFAGTIDPNAGSLTVNAKAVKDYSLLPLSGTASFSGTVSSLNLNGNSFVIATKDHGTVTVAVASSTALLTKGDAAFLLSNLAVGSSVQVKGAYNSSSNTIAATSIRLNSEVSSDQGDNGNNNDQNATSSDKWHAFLNSVQHTFHFNFHGKSE